MEECGGEAAGAATAALVERYSLQKRGLVFAPSVLVNIIITMAYGHKLFPGLGVALNRSGSRSHCRRILSCVA